MLLISIQMLVQKFLVFLFLLEGVSMLSCSFDDGLCGWQHPENASKRWLLNKGISQHIATPYSEPNSLPFSVKLIYPNFTGYGVLSFSYAMEGSITLLVKVGEKTIVKFASKHHIRYVWQWITVPINSSNNEVVLEASKPFMTATEQTAVDDIVFFEKEAPRCTPLTAPINGTINCTSSNYVNSICKFECQGSNLVVGPLERKCLPTGVWSEYQPSCEFPQIRLTSPQGNLSSKAGVVELLFNGTWAPVCTHLTNEGRRQYTNIASLTCRSLGYSNIGINIPSVPMDRLVDSWTNLAVGRECTQEDKSLSQCRGLQIKRYACSSDYLFFITCFSPQCKLLEELIYFMKSNK